MLAMCVTRGAFRDYTTLEGILEIPPPPKKDMHRLHWHVNILNTPFYSTSTGQIQTANLFSGQVKNVGHRAGCAKPPTIHDFRAEGPYLVGKYPLRSFLNLLQPFD